VWSKRVRVGVGDRWCEMVLEEEDEVAVLSERVRVGSTVGGVGSGAGRDGFGIGESVGGGFPSLKRFGF